MVRVDRGKGGIMKKTFLLISLLSLWIIEKLAAREDVFIAHGGCHEMVPKGKQKLIKSKDGVCVANVQSLALGGGQVDLKRCTGKFCRLQERRTITSPLQDGNYYIALVNEGGQCLIKQPKELPDVTMCQPE